MRPITAIRLLRVAALVFLISGAAKVAGHRAAVKSSATGIIRSGSVSQLEYTRFMRPHSCCRRDMHAPVLLRSCQSWLVLFTPTPRHLANGFSSLYRSALPLGWLCWHRDPIKATVTLEPICNSSVQSPASPPHALSAGESTCCAEL